MADYHLRILMAQRGFCKSVLAFLRVIYSLGNCYLCFEKIHLLLKNKHLKIISGPLVLLLHNLRIYLMHRMAKYSANSSVGSSLPGLTIFSARSSKITLFSPLRYWKNMSNTSSFGALCPNCSERAVKA